MQPRTGTLDLDRAAAMIAERTAGWTGWGLTVHPLTWRDDETAWPAPLLHDRRQVHRPESLGLRLEGRDAWAGAQFVLYASGTADVEHVAAGADEVVSEYVELNDVEDFGPVLDRVADRLRPRSTGTPSNG